MTNFTFHVSRFTKAAVALLVIAAVSVPASAQGSITIEDRGVTMEFPERLTFNARIESSAEIDQVVLEYGIEKLTCSAVTAKAFPDFEPGTSIDVSWTWEMLQSGSRPPGAQIWYRWRVSDTAGNESVSDEQRLVWLDDQHAWHSISRGMLTLHWYSGSRDFAEDLLNSAVDSLAQLGETTGVVPQFPIDLYIYADTADLRDAILYEPGWTGGLAYPDYDILLIGISPDQIEWGKDTEAHELTHILVGHLTFSCLGSVPTWLNEGIAVYGEGEPDRASAGELQNAIVADRLIAVRALSGGFSEHPDKASLSYAQSYSLVNFLVAGYGPDKLLTLFGNLRDGLPIEDALNDAYGFGLDGLEDSWRASIGAKPRRAEGVAPTPTAIPTPVPTYRPISGAPLIPPLDATSALAVTLTPTGESLAAVEPSPAPTETPQTIPIVTVLFVALVIGIGLTYVSIQRKRIDR